MNAENPQAWRDDASRYELLRELGAGGSGAVYLVRDRETGEELALKQLHRADERSIARLKREFRSLSNVDHRNVIRLYDLGRAHDVWFLTMEYIAGGDLAGYLSSSNSSSATLTLGAGAAPLALARILDAFVQLAKGVSALHHAHVLHRDLKPSNVLVEHARVVVVDFGLALEVGDQAATVTLNGVVAGTPAYMAPEQIQGRDWGEPNDWYSFGVMLYEALSGQLPIDGPWQQLLRRKLENEPVPLAQRVAGLPRALSTLCDRLLERRIEQRPGGDEVLAVLETCLAEADGGSERAHAEPTTSQRPLTRKAFAEPALIGRALEAGELQRALDDVQGGGFAAVHVRGVSGAGKSALVERFIDELTHASSQSTVNSPPLVLRSRCYERELVPFKALDGAMDALIMQLSREDELSVSYALPSAVGPLVQLFPALGRLSVVKRLLPAQPRMAAAPHTREEAESALRDMFARLSSLRRVVLWIDDLHWGDLDSARMLRGWIEPPGIPGLLLVLSYRSDELATSPCLRSLVGSELTAHERVIALGALDDQHIRVLCRQQLSAAAPDGRVSETLVERVVGEAGGSPFLASQLTALAASDLRDDSLDLSVETLVARRTAQLSAPARRLLHVLSVASRPLPSRLALKLAAAEDSSRAALHELSGLGLVHTREGERERLLAVYHDRLREGVLASLDASERAALDRQLLHALEREGTIDTAWLHALALGAGERGAALRYGILAAAHASEALAFEQAAQLYRACLGVCPDDSAECRELWQKLADALGHAGHGRQAAAAYLEAARRADGELTLQLERRAASHLLRSGAFEEGEALVDKVLTALRLETPSSRVGLLLAIVWERFRLALRGLRFTPRRAEDIPFSMRYGGELYGTLSIEIQPYDPLRAALLQARCLRIALQAGVPELVARALCVAATMYSVASGTRGAAHAKRLLARAAEIAQSLGSTLVASNILSARVVCAMVAGDMRGVLEPSAQVEHLFRRVNVSDEGEYYHRIAVLASRIAALSQLGQHEQARSELTPLVNEARATDNIAALLLLSGVRTRIELADGLIVKAMARLEGERPQLPRQRFGLLHVYHLCSVLRVGCATSDYAWAERNIGDNLARFRRSLFRRGGIFSVIVPAVHARLLLNHSVVMKESVAQATARVAEDVRILERARFDTKTGALARTRARLAFMAGDRAMAREQLERSIRTFEKYEVARDETARDRFALGVIVGGAEGEQLRAAALDVLRSYGHADPLLDLAAYYPELL